MSQIPRSQFALKKRATASPMITIPVEFETQKPKKSQLNGSSNRNGSSNGSGNGHKKGTFDNETIIIEDDCFAVVGHEEVIAVEETVELISPSKKKRSRKSKDSTESKDSDISKKKSDEATKSAEKAQKSRDNELPKQYLTEEVTAAPTEAKELKVVKLTSEGLSSSKRRSDRLVNASTIVNLSSDSSNDQSTKILTDETIEGSPFVPDRRVSGRRSTRPIDDIKYTYRSPNPNDSLNVTTNATIGSEANNDSMFTTPGTDRKRRQLDDSMENLESPKRSRLNLSGLFSSFSSPVALLRNRFKRANIASTPVVGGSEALLNESIEPLDTSAGQMKDVDLNEKDVQTTAETPSADQEELKVITTPIKKTSCTVM